jgi:hypothetical protein
MALDGPRRTRTAPDGPLWPPMAPGWPPMAPGWPPMAPGWHSMAPGWPPMAPGWPSMAPMNFFNFFKIYYLFSVKISDLFINI